MQFFFLLLFLRSLSSQSTIILQQNTIFQKTLSYPDPVYYISQNSSKSASASSSASDFCEIQQPGFEFLYFSQVFDQTDASIFANEPYMLGIDSLLYVFLKRGVLQVFSVNFTENSADLYHMNEIVLDDAGILAEISDSQYFSLFYDQPHEFLLLLTRNKLAFVDLAQANKANWLKTSFYAFADASKVLYAKIEKNFLYVLRENNVFQVWRLENVATLTLVRTVDFSAEFGLGKNAEITDFEINEEFFCFIEKNGKNFFLMNNRGNFSNLSQKIVKNLTFSTNPLRIELTKAKFFVLLDGNSSENTSFLQEFALNSSDFQLLNTKELKDFRDLYIGEDYMIVSYENNAVLSPFSFIQPEDANAGLEAVFDVKNLQFIEPFIVTADNSSVFPFKVMKDSGLQLMKIKRKEAVLSCNTKDAGFGEYSLNLSAFVLKCEFLDEKCDKTLFYRVAEEITIKVEENSANIQFLRGNSGDDNEKTVDILAVLLAVSLALLIFCGVFAWRAWRASNADKLVTKDPLQIYVDRVISKEELESIGEKVATSEKIHFET